MTMKFVKPSFKLIHSRSTIIPYDIRDKFIKTCPPATQIDSNTIASMAMER